MFCFALCHNATPALDSDKIFVKNLFYLKKKQSYRERVFINFKILSIEFNHIDELLNKAEHLITETNLGHKVDTSSLITKPNLQFKKHPSEMSIKTIPASSGSNLNLKTNKKSVNETKNNSKNLNKKSTLLSENSVSSKIHSISLIKENLTKLTRHQEFVYEGVSKCRNEISVDQTNLNFYKFSLLGENNFLMNLEIQSRRKKKKASTFIANLEKVTLNSDRIMCNSNGVKLYNLFMNNIFLYKQETKSIEQNFNNKCSYEFFIM